MLHVSRAEYQDGFRVHLQFIGGASGIVDRADCLDGPIFEPLKKLDQFKQFKMTGHTLAWDNGAELATEYLRNRLLIPKHLPAHTETSARILNVNLYASATLTNTLSASLSSTNSRIISLY